VIRYDLLRAANSEIVRASVDFELARAMSIGMKAYLAKVVVVTGELNTGSSFYTTGSGPLRTDHP